MSIFKRLRRVKTETTSHAMLTCTSCEIFLSRPYCPGPFGTRFTLQGSFIGIERTLWTQFAAVLGPVVICPNRAACCKQVRSGQVNLLNSHKNYRTVIF